MRRIFPLCVWLALIALVPLARAQDDDPPSRRVLQNLIRMAISDRGYVGNCFSSMYDPSLRYPAFSHVEHLWVAGLWVGARTADGLNRVTTAAVDNVNISNLLDRCEFFASGEPVRIISNNQGDPDWDPAAIADYQLECWFHDDGQNGADHVPLGLRVELRALAWDDFPFDDTVVLDLSIINVSGDPLSDVYVGWYDDTTVGNTDINDPYDPNAPVRWNYYDDKNGGWRPGDLPDDPDLWMMWEHDNDGDGGYATSWVGCRLLGMEPQAEPSEGVPAVSYNACVFSQFPDFDDVYADGQGVEQPGRYQMMGNGDFDSGVTADDDYTRASDWGGLLSTGPVPQLADGDTIHVSFAMVCGPDSLSLWQNSRRIAQLHDAGWVQESTPAPETIAAGVHLAPASPNPCNPSTTIRFGLAVTTDVDLAIYTVDGRLVRRLVQAALPAGEHRLTWNGHDDTGHPVASGMYLVRLTAGSHPPLTQRLMLVR